MIRPHIVTFLFHWSFESTHLAYAGPQMPSTIFRPLINTQDTGDPVKAAKAVITISEADDPRLATGIILPSHCKKIVPAILRCLTDPPLNAEDWEALSMLVVANDSDMFLSKLTLGPATCKILRSRGIVQNILHLICISSSKFLPDLNGTVDMYYV